MNTVTHFRYTADSTETVEAALEYVPAASGGWCVICGSLPAQDPHAGRGITVPEEIDGTPVTELHTAWYGPLDFISGPGCGRRTSTSGSIPRIPSAVNKTCRQS